MNKVKIRQTQVLRNLVEEYVKTVVPVSSGLLSEKYLKDFSPATVRMDLVKLENSGLLLQPHTSSGRIPTIQGYREYLKIIEPEIDEDISSQNETLQNLLLQDYKNSTLSLHYIMRYLAKQTDQLSFVAEPEILFGYLKRISVFKISSKKLLFVISLNSGMDKTVIIKCDYEISTSQLKHLVRYVNDKFIGLRIFDIQSNYLSSNKIVESKEILLLFLDELSKALKQLSSYYIHFDGNITFLEQPEFDSKKSILTFFSVLRRQDTLISLMKRNIGKKNYSVLLGEDLLDPNWIDFTLIFSRYELFNVPGFLGILAPNRIDYKKHIKMVRNSALTISTTTSRSQIVKFY